MAQNLLNVKRLSMAYGVEPLFEDVGFGVHDGERVAIVGPNGCGKTTLFKIIAGKVTPDDGEIALRTGTTVGYLAQDPKIASHETPAEIVARAMLPVREAIEQHAEITAALERVGNDAPELLERQGDLQDRIRNLGGWDWRHRIDEMLDRLGVSDLVDIPMGRLSGGQRRRVDLARVLLEAPDLLLLDEPTNHLDTGAVEWLEGWLKAHSKTLLLVTHDRYFLERVVERILEVDDEGFFDYPGNYETFMERKLQRMAIRKRTEERRQHLLKKELEWLRGGVKARNTRSQKRVKQIEEMREEGPAWEEQKKMEMELAEASRLGDVILAGRGLHKSFGDNELLHSASIALRPGDKLGIVGPNGCGKTTLLHILMGDERPDAGAVEEGDRTKIAYLRQDGIPVDPEATVYEAMGESDYVWVGDHRYHKRDYLERFLFDHDLQGTQIRVLSGGQTRRLALARLVAENANVLILDEPTNDLDILSLQALESALESFDGCVVAVSHDRYFLNRVCTAIVAFEDRQLVRYTGDYDEYRAAVRRREELEVASLPTAPTPERSAASVDDEPNRLTYAERLRIEDLEVEIAEQEELKAKVEAELSDPDLYARRADEIEPLNRKLTEVTEQLEALMNEWMELEERR